MIAEQLVWAELRGIPALGMKKIPQFSKRLLAGGAAKRSEAKVVSDHGGLVHLDGQNGWSYVVAIQAMDMAMAKARSGGVGAAVIRDTSSAGALGYFALHAAKQGMVGLVINNSPEILAAPGGIEGVIGTQAFAVASPARRHPPLVLDMANSAITWARAHEYLDRGERLPENVALAADGTPTVDPAAALAGWLLPMGGHRGFGLALLWEVLTGVLSGGSRLLDVGVPDEYDRPQGVSMFLLAINPEVIMPFDDFVTRVDELIDRVHSSATAPGVDRLLVPGERSHRVEEERARDGIPVSGEMVATLKKVGAELGVPWT